MILQGDLTIPSPGTAPGEGDRTPPHAPRVWGLGAAELHDAFWRSRGVQVVRRETAVDLDRDAELYLLVEPTQAVCFNLSPIALRMLWDGADVVRLRVADAEARRYRERIDLDSAGDVAGIRRVYGERGPAGYRVILTRSRQHAEWWRSGATRREVWRRLRQSTPYFRIVHRTIDGRCYEETDIDDQRSLIERLVAIWPDPDRAIEGIEQIADGVFAVAGSVIDEESVAISPAWIGLRVEDAPPLAIVGPAAVADDDECGGDGCTDGARAASIRVRPIREIDPGDDEDDAARRAVTRVASQPIYAGAKRAFDVAVSGAVLLALSPVLAAVALAILIDDGRPFFYAHTRQTRGGRNFRCWKFRTMRRDADRLVAELRALNECDGPQFFIRNDPRVTRVGRILRKTHLDELPQFWNVLTGEMSIVGPRPSPDDENQLCPAWREARLSVRPGITGLWQVERTRAPGRDFQEWIRFDTEYVERASFPLDLLICIKTAFKLLRRS